MKVIPVVVGALGAISKKLEVCVEKGGIEVSVGLLQKVALCPGIVPRLVAEARTLY